jgi:beta-galactosidase/beta-glucuronidase
MLDPIAANDGPLPRPEYPRPQLVRREWLNLNGAWGFAWDDAERGLPEGWQDGRALPGRIVVPFPYQSALSGIHDRAIHEVVWYARGLEVPPEWRGRPLLLHFGAVDYRTTVWVNGREVGHNRGGHVPFSVNIAPYLRSGENRLTLRVEDRQDLRQPRGKQSPTGRSQGIDYPCTTGIWQTVWLEPVPALRISSLRVTPTEDDAFDLQVFLHAPATGWQVEAEARDGEQVVARAAARTRGAVASLRLEIPQPRRWSPESPHLYGLRVRVMEGGRALDEVESYAGLRTARLEEGWLLLNGRRTYLVTALDQGYWPEGLMTAPSDAALRADVEWAKRLGFNGVRKHQKVEDPRWLHWCDRLGLLVWGEMANARAWSTEAEEALLAEWERAVRRDVNHPCVITWVPINESWGAANWRENHPGEMAFLERLVTATRLIDPERPVIDNDGWEHSDVSDICAIHDYTRTGAGLRERFAGAAAGGPLPATIWTGTRPIFLGEACHRGQPVMLTEVGGFWTLPPDLPLNEQEALRRPNMEYVPAAELPSRYQELMEGIAALPMVTGFCFTELTDIEDEVDGLLSYRRTPKLDPEAVAAAHRPFHARSEPQDP